MSFLNKFKVPLNPMYRFYKEVVKLLFLPIEQKYIENKNFHRVVYITIISWARVARVGYNQLISNKHEWNNCFS